MFKIKINSNIRGGRCGGIIFYPGGNKVVDFSWGLGSRTNNEAEWLAIYHSLEIASTLNMEKLQVLGDSRHVIQAMRNGSLRRSKSQRFRKRTELLPLPTDTLFFHVLKDLNSTADKLANIGATLEKGQLLQNKFLEYRFIH